MIQPVTTTNAPKAVGPYSQGLVANGFVFCAGQIGLDPTTGNFVGETVEEQTKQVIINLKGILEEAGSSLEHIVQTTCYLSDMADYATFNEVYGSFFAIHKPARATVQVAALPRNAKVEIAAIATLK